MKNKRILSFLAVLLFAFSLLSGCAAAEGASNTLQSSKAQESSGHIIEGQQKNITLEVYPVDLGYEEYVELIISDEVSIDADRPDPEEPSEIIQVPSEPENPPAEETAPTQPGETVFGQFNSTNADGIIDNGPENDGKEKPNVAVFRFRDTDMASGSIIYRLQVQKLEEAGLTVFYGTLYPGEKVTWDTDGDIFLQSRLQDALLEELDWISCADNGVYAHNQMLSKYVAFRQNVIYTDAASAVFQIQSYDDTGRLCTVAELTQDGARQMLLDEVGPIEWSEDPQQVIHFTVEEQPVYDDTELRNQIASSEERISSLNQEIAKAEQTIIVLYAVAGVLAASNLICVLILLRRKKRRTKKKKDALKQEHVPQVVENVRNIGVVHNIGGRSGQQDSFDVINCSAGTLAVVADGMGGLADGDKVSQKIVATMRADSVRIHPGNTDSVLCQMVAHANQEVNRMLGASRQYKCGSTLLAVLIENDRMQWITVGDSRIYLYRGGELIQINREHIYCAELLEHAINGKLSFTEALRDPQVDRLSSFVGMGELKHVDICLNRLKLCAGDHILLMSDGVFNTLSEDEIAQSIKTSENASKAAAILEEQVLKKNAPNQDNFTCVILEV